MKIFWFVAAAVLFTTTSTAWGISYVFTKVADETTVAAGSTTFSSFNRFTAIDSGVAAFYGNWSNLTQRGIFTGSGGAITRIAGTGDASPIGPFSQFHGLSISDGEVAFVAGGRDGIETPFGVFTGSGGILTTIAKEGDPAPNQTFDFFPFTT